jgi:uncharacterized protein (DUF952 family)
MALIYKILRPEEWLLLSANGVFEGSPVDLHDGFIHFSAADQVTETLARHFAGDTELVLLAVDGDAVGESLRWEVSRGGALFPHLYAQLCLADIRETRRLKAEPGRPGCFTESTAR